MNRAHIILILGVLAVGCTELRKQQSFAIDAGPVCESKAGACVSNQDCERGEICSEQGRCDCVAPLVAETDALPAAVVGKPYLGTIEVRGGAEPYAFQLLEPFVSPQLDWLRLDPVTGRLDGTPAELTSEARGLRVAIEDQAQQTITLSLTLEVVECREGELVTCFVARDAACLVGEGRCTDGVPPLDCNRASASDDPEHCGEACESCDPERANTCSAGVCTCGAELACEDGRVCCGEGEQAHCIDPIDDANHCGACGNACEAGEGMRRVAVCRGGACQAPACESGWGACDFSDPDDCTTDVTRSEGDCGMCGRTCPIPGRSDGCEAGRCVCGEDARTCSGLETCCAGEACTDLSEGARVADGIARCGDCAAELCPNPTGHGAATCEDGICGARCDESSEEQWTDCNVAEGSLPLDCGVDLLRDSMHCGDCATQCPSASSPSGTGAAVCAMGSCAIECAPGHVECAVGSGTTPVGCFDLQDDASRCGGCDDACSSEHITPACSDGECTGECEADYASCDNTKRTHGCPTHLPTDTEHCGACGNACSLLHREPGCVDGQCTGACMPGYGDCDDSRDNGCETDTRLSLDDCGACDRSCASLHVANALCEDGRCNGECAPGYQDCNVELSLAGGCEIYIDGDVDHCGGCLDSVCSGNNIARTCEGGQCTGQCTLYTDPIVGAQFERFADCYNGKQLDGCETDLWENLGNCGACGAPCPPDYLCGWDGVQATCFYAPVCEGCCCNAVGAASPAGSGRSGLMAAGLLLAVLGLRNLGRRARPRAPEAVSPAPRR